MNRSLPVLIALLLATGAASAQYRFASYGTSFGNSYLGGSVSVSGQANAYRSSTTEMGYAGIGASAYANVLRQRLQVASFSATARNIINLSTNEQDATASVYARFAGLTVSRSLQTSGTLADLYRYFQLFPVDPRVSVPVGPISIGLRGNAGAGFDATARVLLPTSQPQVWLLGTARTWAFGRAAVSIGYPGFSVGVEVEGRLADQELRSGIGAHARNGLSGYLTYSLRAISLYLRAYAEAFFYRFTNTLTSWRSAALSRTLFSF